MSSPERRGARDARRSALRGLVDLDVWREIVEPLRASKLRTAATALSVAWGIFMLVILLAAGRGIENGARYEFRDDAVNSVWVYGGRTTKAHGGYAPGRDIRFRNADLDAVIAATPEVDHATGRFYLTGEFTVRHERNVSSFQVRACHPGHQFLENTEITAGRFINDADVHDRRKVAVIGPRVVELLFKRKAPLGEWISVSGTPYRVVGVFDDDGGEREQAILYVPISTAQTAYGGGDTLHQIMFTVGDASAREVKRIATETTDLLARRHHFDADDEQAVHVRHFAENFEKLMSVFANLRVFIWIVGIGTILAGVVGVSNIMLISVRERTREIGLRKALGAEPGAIIRQIVFESLIITSVSGYAGLIAGLGLVEFINRSLPPVGMFRNPDADIAVVLGATAVIVVCGVVAGYVPARIAARINPVEALRSE